MSFFKKMVDKFEDLVGDDDKKKAEHKEEKHEGSKDQNSYPSQPAPYDQHQQAAYAQQPQYGQEESAYGNQQQAYGAPPPQSQPSGMGGPPLPPGWISQWDQNSQRYYFLEQATGRTQWDPPQQSIGSHGGYAPPGGPPMGERGFDSHGQQGAPGGYYSQETKQVVSDGHGGLTEVHEKKEKKDGKGGMLAAGAGGLAVGAVGGAMIGHALGEDDSSDEEHHHEQQPTYGQQPAYVQETTYYQQEPPLPTGPPPGSDHGSVSSSDKEELAEAREEYENASDASDREEAREEYEEKYEETYDD